MVAVLIRLAGCVNPRHGMNRAQTSIRSKFEEKTAFSKNAGDEAVKANGPPEGRPFFCG